MKVHCPDCQGIFGVERPEIGSEFDCPFCQTRFSFRDKATVVVSKSPQTQVKFEADAAAATAVSANPPGRSRPASEAPTHSVPPVPPNEYTHLAPGDVVGGYRLQEVIGWGGMSVVYRATQLSLDRSVALKVLRKDLADDPEFSQRFLKEARTLADLSHPNIVQVIDQGVHEGSYFLVMEYIDGVSLRDILNEKKLSPAEALKLVPALCSALEYAHDRGVVHRDIKPENLIITRSGVPKIADFGLVRILGATPDVVRLTKTQTIMGTIEYMAPEQREGSRDVDHRADIYSLGVVLYEMLTGELPIARFPLPSERVQVDVRLDDVVLKVLEKDRDRRYQRASLIATDLQRLETEAMLVDPKRPRATGHRILTMFQNPLVFLACLFTLAAVIGDADEEFLLLCVGVSVPLILAQSILHGLLPRPIASREFFFYRHPMFAALTLAAFSLVLNRAFEEATWLLVGGSLSAGLCVWRWRSRLFRRPGEPRFIQPNTAFAKRGVADHSLRERDHGARGHRAMATPPVPGAPSDSSPLAAGPLEHGVGAANSFTAAASAPHAVKGGSEPAADETSSSTPGSGSSRSPGASDTARAGALPTPRLSWTVVLGFLLTLGTSLYVAAIWIGVRWVDLDSLLAYSTASYGEVADFFREGVWSTSPRTFHDIPTALTFLGFVPLLLPLLVNLLALIPLQSPRKRGGRLLLVSGVLLGIQVLAGVSLAQRIHVYAEHYREAASVPREISEASAAQLEQVVESLRSEDEAWMRFALLHRAIELGRLGCTTSTASRQKLLEAASQRANSPIERIATLIVLDELTPEISEPNSNPTLEAWLQKLARAGLNDPDPAVREAYLTILSRTQSSAPKELFWDSLRSGHSRRAPIAVEWWTEYAPRDAVEWLGHKYSELPQPTLIRWLQRLEKSSSARFLFNEEIRTALLSPLVQHSDPEVRHRAQQLILQTH